MAELKVELKDTAKGELKEELRDNVKETLKRELRDEAMALAKAELADEVRKNLSESLRDEVMTSLKQSLRADALNELKEDLRPSAMQALKEELIAGKSERDLLFHLELVRDALRAYAGGTPSKLPEGTTIEDWERASAIAGKLTDPQSPYQGEKLWKSIRDAFALKRKIMEDIQRDERLGGEKREFYLRLKKSVEEILVDAVATFEMWLHE
jgi:hypothetical protein